MTTYDIVPDIHGQYDKLKSLLALLGYQWRDTAWRHPEQHRKIVFLGDFIDRGPDNQKVLHTVRNLMDADRALAIMGNHELNAIHFHTEDPHTGQPLREHSAKNLKQHASFLQEMPYRSAGARETVAWMSRLPLWLDLGSFRVVHACWSQRHIELLSDIISDGRLSDDQLIQAARKGSQIHQAADVITKGPEMPLPEGYTFEDKDGHFRRDVRIAWWRSAATRWPEAAMSVPDSSALPNTPLPKEARDLIYPHTEKPVFFGHYWLTGPPPLETPNALCLDCSAGKDGPLISYVHTSEDTALSLDRVVGHPELG